KRFLTITRNHSGRLANLVEDIQMLINLEQIGKLNLEPVKLKKFAENIKQLYEPKIQDLPIELILEVDDTIDNFNGDIFKLDQIFINLIDNALRYTTQGTIKLKIEKNNKYARFIVSDTGCGIEHIHLDRLFERFYVADKARSRKMGGTGLGLAIVKHIVMLHKGTVTVESELNKGTAFIINIPLDLK
ncbi:MAG: GHKL domain-containing protein, partial [Candidatus Cloacimonetes bacterium]|nr:GHKL domain-containing protein [Candidatus Cloacimonadota bacterium]